VLSEGDVTPDTVISLNLDVPDPTLIALALALVPNPNQGVRNFSPRIHECINTSDPHPEALHPPSPSASDWDA